MSPPSLSVCVCSRDADNFVSLTGRRRPSVSTVRWLLTVVAPACSTQCSTKFGLHYRAKCSFRLKQIAAAVLRHESHCLLWTCQRGGSLWQWRHFGQRSHQPGCNEIQKSIQQGISHDSLVLSCAKILCSTLCVSVENKVQANPNLDFGH